MNKKGLIAVIMAVSYGVSSVEPSFSLKIQPGLSIPHGFEMVCSQEIPHLPLSVPLNFEHGDLDAVDNYSQDDENHLALGSISILPSTYLSGTYYLNNAKPPGSLNPPFSPPELQTC